MGFDIYGKMPDLKSKPPPSIDFSTTPKPSEKEISEFFQNRDIFLEANPGYYFRNNSWYWRPLWHFICDLVAPSVLSEEDKKRGEFNDGHLISAIKAIYIANKLDELDANGTLNEYEERYKKTMEDLPQIPCNVCGGSGTENQSLQVKCMSCKGIGTVKDFACNYPFESSNVRDFSKFARASGGFEIR